jgi:3-methyladenine DNA glycosylase AlkD
MGEPIDNRFGTVEAEALAEQIALRIRALPEQRTQPIRRVRREYSKRLQAAPADAVVALAMALLDRHRWVAYELIYHHPGGLACLRADDVERLGQGINGWASVDAFGCSISGPAWRLGSIGDDTVHRWAASPDRWWRRAAVVSTVPLNVRARGGTGDTVRTLDICERLAADRDDMVVKAVSWALRALTVWDAEAVREFVRVHDDVIAASIQREVRNKLLTGLKDPSRSPRSS